MKTEAVNAYNEDEYKVKTRVGTLNSRQGDIQKYRGVPPPLAHSHLNALAVINN